MRILFKISAISLIVLIGCDRPQKQGKTQSRPNIIFIMSDDHAQRAISAYTRELISTPNIDRLAEEGVLFRNSFVTNSICAPSRAVMLTGKYSHLNGLRDNRDRFDGNQLTWIKLLRQSGYHTSLIGKWHLKSEPQGFDHYNILIGQGAYYNPRMVENGDTLNLEGYTTSIITELALSQLDKREDGKPFLMLVHHKAPHRNWMPEPKYFELFEDEKIPLPSTFFDDYSTRSAAAQEQDMRIGNMFLSTDLKLRAKYIKEETGTGGGPENWLIPKDAMDKQLTRLTPEQRKLWDACYDEVGKKFMEANLTGKELLEWKYQRYMQDYLRSIASVDESVGKILDWLDENNQADSTIVVYTSDQGFYLGEHGWYDKRFMYEESLRTPLIARIPGEVQGGSEMHEMVLNLDLAPTFLDYAGVEIPDEMQGQSWRKLVNGEDDNWRKSLYYHYYEYPHGWHYVKRHYGVRSDRYKLIHFYNDIDAWELFDLESDPDELNNLYGDVAYAAIQSELEGELKRLRDIYGDTLSLQD